MPKSLTFLYQAFRTADISSNADAINKAKDIVGNVGSIDRLRDKNIELNKLNQSMSVDLKTTKESLTKAEQALEMEKQKHNDALREVQDRLDKRLDESVAIDDQLLSKFYLKILYSLLYALVIVGYNFVLAFASSGRLWT